MSGTLVDPAACGSPALPAPSLASAISVLEAPAATFVFEALAPAADLATARAALDGFADSMHRRH